MVEWAGIEDEEWWAKKMEPNGRTSQGQEALKN